MYFRTSSRLVWSAFDIGQSSVTSPKILLNIFRARDTWGKQALYHLARRADRPRVKVRIELIEDEEFSQLQGEWLAQLNLAYG